MPRIRKTRYVICILEDGKWRRTNWVLAYQRDKLRLRQSNFYPRYSTTQDIDLVNKALFYAQKEYPSNKYSIKHA